MENQLINKDNLNIRRPAASICASRAALLAEDLIKRAQLGTTALENIARQCDKALQHTAPRAQVALCHVAERLLRKSKYVSSKNRE